MIVVLFALGVVVGAVLGTVMARAPFVVRLIALAPVAVYGYAVYRGLQGPDPASWAAGVLGATTGSCAAMLWRSRHTQAA